jgi:hypothetical protein
MMPDPDRGFTGVVIGEPQRAFYGNQFSLTFPILTHFGVQLWVPEVGGPIDPGSEAHDLVMTLFGGMSKGERTRVKTRVRAAMSAQTATEGRFLGGRPPYGYRLADAGSHPTPSRPPSAPAYTGWSPTRPRHPDALERPGPLDLVHSAHPSAADQPGHHLPSRPGPHRHPITS